MGGRNHGSEEIFVAKNLVSVRANKGRNGAWSTSICALAVCEGLSNARNGALICRKLLLIFENVHKSDEWYIQFWAIGCSGFEWGVN